MLSIATVSLLLMSLIFINIVAWVAQNEMSSSASKSKTKLTLLAGQGKSKSPTQQHSKPAKKVA